MKIEIFLMMFVVSAMMALLIFLLQEVKPIIGLYSVSVAVLIIGTAAYLLIYLSEKSNKNKKEE